MVSIFRQPLLKLTVLRIFNYGLFIGSSPGGYVIDYNGFKYSKPLNKYLQIVKLKG